MGKNFKILALTLLLANVAVGFSIKALWKFSEDDRIVGGKGIDISQAPHQVSFHYQNDFTCGGTIVNSETVITAAHCVSDIQDRSLKDYLIRAGSTNRSSGGYTHQVESITIHPNNTEYFDYDIAIMKVSPPFQFSAKVAAVGMMNAGEEIEDGSMVSVTGWGVVSYSQKLPENLHMVEVPTVNHEVCNKDYTNIFLIMEVTPRMMCTGFPNGGKNPCNGDSGGPMIYEGRLAGVVSWGWICGNPNAPAVYAKISALRSWVDENIH